MAKKNSKLQIKTGEYIYYSIVYVEKNPVELKISVISIETILIIKKLCIFEYIFIKSIYPTLLFVEGHELPANNVTHIL